MASDTTKAFEKQRAKVKRGRPKKGQEITADKQASTGKSPHLARLEVLLLPEEKADIKARIKAGEGKNQSDIVIKALELYRKNNPLPK